MVLTDSGRHYKPGAKAGDRLYYRPVEIDCWYPVASAEGNPMHYGEFLTLFQERANRFQDDTIYAGIAGQMAQYLCTGLEIKDTASLMNFATESYRDASPVRRRFPLIVYMCSYNGMSYENTRLFEVLAKRGYIIASVTSVGRYPGNMTTDPADLQEQVADGLFTINVLRKIGFVDTAKVGVIGYSWGGPAAFLLADSPYVKAVLSLDGSELHYYGQSAEDDGDFNKLRPDLGRAAKSSFAYAYLESDGKQSQGPADSIYNAPTLFQGPKKYILFPKVSHEDLSCLRFLAASIQKTDLGALPDYPAFAINWFDHYLKDGSNK